MKTHKISIKGMHCSSCSGNVQKVLTSVPGVLDASVSILTHKAKIESNDDVSEIELKKAIEKLGYSVISIE